MEVTAIEWDLITRKPRTYTEFARKGDWEGARRQLDEDMAVRGAK